MEIQNLRLQLLHIADGNVEAAKLMEAYVLAEAKPAVDAELNLGEAPKTEALKTKAGEEECRCFVCFIEKAFKEQNIKF